MRYNILLILVLFSFAAHSQGNVGAETGNSNLLRDTSSISLSTLEDWRSMYGLNKKYSPAIEKLVLFTFSFFPELRENKIEVKIRTKGAPLSSRPSWGTFWRSSGKRKYMVFIHIGKDSSLWGTFFTRADIPGKVGILGHELCHISEFKKKTSLGLMGLGIAHISSGYMDKFEFKTDSMVIAKGMGYYLLDWAKMIDKLFAGTGMTDPFKNNNTPTGERYMSAATVEVYIQKSGHPAYKK